ncbi:MAG: hypothetical protein EOO40_07845 [Deltaproteobacteria bacterium]|nr:MAG: hypothetical protein EOO40_07845 [Deltaproteobacteria bacterium]
MGCGRGRKGSTKGSMGRACGQDKDRPAEEHAERAGRAGVRQGYRGVSARGRGPERHGTKYLRVLTMRNSGRPALDWLLTEKRIAAYVGVDPTAPSLHVGHLLPLMALYWMYLHGYHTVSLVSDLRFDRTQQQTVNDTS